jgi:hypothetical protein
VYFYNRAQPKSIAVGIPQPVKGEDTNPNDNQVKGDKLDKGDVDKGDKGKDETKDNGEKGKKETKDDKEKKSDKTVQVELPALPVSVPLKPVTLKESTTYPLNDKVKAVAVGGAGRFLVLHLSKASALAIFDVMEGKTTLQIPVADDNTRFAAGMTKLLIYSPKDQHLQRWNLLTQQKEHEAPFKMEAKLLSFCMGSASSGPLLISGTNTPSVEFFDIESFDRLAIKVANNSSFPASSVYWPAANGRAFGSTHVGLGQPNGVAALRLVNGEFQYRREHKGTWYVKCGPEGKLLYPGGHDLWTMDMKRWPWAPDLGGVAEGDVRRCFLPAHHDPFYLNLHLDEGLPKTAKDQPAHGVTIYLLGSKQPVIRLSNLGMARYKDLEGVMHVGIENMVHLIPRAQLLVVIPPSLDRLLLHPIKLVDALNNTKINYALVTSQPPAHFVRGQPFEYQLETTGNATKVSFVLESGPPGMTLSPQGQLTWLPAKDLDANAVDVEIRIAATEGNVQWHQFSLTAMPPKMP